MRLIKTTLFISILFVSSAMATEIHKWVDEHGITHYSDEAPGVQDVEVTLIEVPATYSTNKNSEEDYYSITNQWKRIHEERIALEKIKLEKAKYKAAQQPSQPQVVYYEDRGGGYYFGNPNYFSNRYKHRHNYKYRKDYRNNKGRYYSGRKYNGRKYSGRSDRLLGYSGKSYSGRHARSGRYSRSTGLSINIR